MEPFSNEVLTILALVSISWAGVTCILAVVLLIVYLCSVYKKKRRLQPFREDSVVSTVTMDNRPRSDSLLPGKQPVRNNYAYNQPGPPRYRYDTMTPIDEQPYPSHPNQVGYGPEDYRYRSEVTEPARTARRKPYQPIRPAVELRGVDRHTPYPVDVVIRDQVMNANRFPLDDRH